MTTSIRRWGNSQGLYIPKEMLNTLGLQIYDSVQLFVQNDSIVIKKDTSKEKKIEALNNLKSLRIRNEDLDYKEEYLSYLDERYLNE